MIVKNFSSFLLYEKFDGDVAAPMEMWWLRWRCGGSYGDVVAQMEMWWLKWRCGGSNGDVVVLMEMWWLIGSTPDFWGRGPGFKSSISHNDPGVLQDHCVIL